jgi:hypothetical protein
MLPFYNDVGKGDGIQTIRRNHHSAKLHKVFIVLNVIALSEKHHWQ